MAEITSQGIYNILSGNEVFFNDTKLACVASGTSQSQWSYKYNQSANSVIVSATSWNSTTGISTLTITTTQQGYYTCTPIAGGTTYTVAIFDPEVTTSKLSNLYNVCENCPKFRLAQCGLSYTRPTGLL